MWWTEESLSSFVLPPCPSHIRPLISASPSLDSLSATMGTLVGCIPMAAGMLFWRAMIAVLEFCFYCIWLGRMSWWYKQWNWMDPMGVMLHLQQKNMWQGAMACDWMPQLSILLIFSFLTARTGRHVDFTTTTIDMLWWKSLMLRNINKNSINWTKDVNWTSIIILIAPRALSF